MNTVWVAENVNLIVRELNRKKIINFLLSFISQTYLYLVEPRCI